MGSPSLDCVPVEIVRVYLEPFLCYRSLFNLSATSKMYHPILQRNLLPRLRKDCDEAFPIKVLDSSLLTGGFLLSLLAGTFESQNVDLVLDCPEDEARAQFRINIGRILEAAGWQYVLDDQQLPVHEQLAGAFRLRTRFISPVHYREIHLYEPETEVSAVEAVDLQPLSISRLWFNSEELYVYDLPNATNLNGHGYKSFLFDYIADTDASGSDVLAMEKSVCLQETKYRLRGYLLGLGELSDSEDEED